MQSMLDAGISTRRGVMCAHREPAYRTEPWRCEGRDGRLPTAGRDPCAALAQGEASTAHGLILPLYVGMRDEDQARVVAILTDACTRAGECPPGS